MTQKQMKPTVWSARPYVIAGWSVIALLFGLGGWWCYTYEIAGAVVTQGELRSKSQPKLVAHRSGGVVAAVRTREGAEVVEGEVLIELESLREKSNVAALEARIADQQAIATRLRAERDAADTLVFPDALLTKAENDEGLATTLADQRAQFKASTEGIGEQLVQFDKRKRQLERQIEANEARLASYSLQYELLHEDLAAQEALLKPGFVAANSVRELRRQVSSMGGEIAALVADNARLMGQIDETESASLQVQASRRETAISQLQENQTELTELKERYAVASDELRRTLIIAPQDGIVQGLSVFATGAVLTEGQTALTLIPADDVLVIEARIATMDRDRVYLGQPARVKFTAFNTRTTPEISATVSRIAADRQVDPNTAASTYLVELTLIDGAEAMIASTTAGGSQELSPGIPADIFISTEQRTVLSFLMRPLIDNMKRVAKER